MRHKIFAPLIPWIYCPKIQTEPRMDFRMQHSRTHLAPIYCSVDDLRLCCSGKPPPHISCTTASVRLCVTNKAPEANQAVAVIPTGSKPLQMTQHPIQLGPGIAPEVLLFTSQCESGQYHSRVPALLFACPLFELVYLGRPTMPHPKQLCNLLSEVASFFSVQGEVTQGTSVQRRGRVPHTMHTVLFLFILPSCAFLLVFANFFMGLNLLVVTQYW